MLFNSIDFAIFFPLVFIVYWFVAKKDIKFQNLLLLGASYFFYSCWDWKFLFLLMFSTGLDYFTGIKMENIRNGASKKFWFWLSIVVNLGLLGVFKYYNFFISSFSDALTMLGFQANVSIINIILPVGISFYTFHGLSYVIDIYKGRIKAERNFVDYAVFVSYFPLLVAGPIERATHLLPQIQRVRTFDYQKSVDGLRQILWGLFKKIVIADTCAKYANEIFGNHTEYSALVLVCGAIFFTFQIYCDFSGYSDIALGISRLLGIELLKNFAFPYFSRDIAEFWRRWHISLSTWFKDYLYIPLGGSKGGTLMKVRNTFIIFIVSGFWHGANWTFIVWGALNALYFLPLLLSNRNRDNIGIIAEGSLLPSLRDFGNMILTFSLTVFAWIFFRAENLSHAWDYIGGIFLNTDGAGISSVMSWKELIDIGALLSGFIFIEWIGREGRFALSSFSKIPLWMRWGLYFSIVLLLFIYSGQEQPFIYFQF